MPDANDICGSSVVVSHGSSGWSTVSNTVGVPTMLVPSALSRADQICEGAAEPPPSLDFQRR